MLSNARRRYVLHYLKQRNGAGPVSLRELVDQVAAWEFNTTIDQLESSDRKSVYTSLKQTHLPRLDEFGIINYNESRGHVELTEQADEVQLYLEYVPADDITWSQYYLGLSGLCAFLVAAVWLDVPLLGALSWAMLAIAFVGMFIVSSFIHMYMLQRNRLGQPGAIEVDRSR